MAKPDIVTVKFERKALAGLEGLFKLGTVRDMFGNRLEMRVDEYAPGKATISIQVEGTVDG